jgi:hypothetical protein
MIMSYPLKPLNDPARHTASAMHAEAAADAAWARSLLSLYGRDHPGYQFVAGAVRYKAKLAAYYGERECRPCG